MGRPVSGVQKWGFGVIGFAVMALLPIYTPPFLDTPGVSFDGAMAQFAMIAIVAIGLNVVVGQAGLLDLGYVGFYAVGAYTVALLTSPQSPWNQLSATGFFSTDWAWLSCVPLAMAFTALAGLILGFPTLRLRGDYLAIVDAGVRRDHPAARRQPQRCHQRFPRPRLDRLPAVRRGQSSRRILLRRATRWATPTTAPGGTGWGSILVAIILLLVGNLERSRVGRAWVAIREDEDAAEVMGVNTFRFKLWAFVIGAGIGGLSGALYAGQVQFVAPTNFNIINSMLFLSAVVLGGQGNKLGVIFGAFIIVYLPNRLLGVHLFGVNLGDLKYLFFGLALVLSDDLPAAGPVPGPPAVARLRQGGANAAATRRRFEGGGMTAPEATDASMPATTPRPSTRNWRHCTATCTRPRVKRCLETRTDREVRWPGRSGRGQVQHQTGRDPRPDRAERCGQDHLLQRDHRRVPADLGAGDVRRCTAGPDQAPTRSPARGIARTFQNIRLFGEMTALENVDGRHRRAAPDRRCPAPCCARPGTDARSVRAVEGRSTCWNSSASRNAARKRPRTCRYGDQRRLEIARALATDPKLLCLDEPAAGFNPSEKPALIDLIRAIRDDGVHRAADRARHAAGDGRHRPHRGAGVRPQDRRRPAGGDPR